MLCFCFSLEKIMKKKKKKFIYLVSSFDANQFKRATEGPNRDLIYQTSLEQCLAAIKEVMVCVWDNVSAWTLFWTVFSLNR